MQTAVLLLNLLVSCSSAGWAVAALFRPAALSRSARIEPEEVFYARMYAARTIPLGMTVGILPFYFKGSATVWVLFTAALVQFADVVIAVSKKERGMALGASIGTIVHILCGLALL